jgi:hypothetical protein
VLYKEVKDELDGPKFDLKHPVSASILCFPCFPFESIK